MELLSFETAEEFRSWLAVNHETSRGVWLRIYKKGSGQKSITYPQALDEALCFGWIDGQLKPWDESSWLRKFSPRKPKSGWSKINREHVERLTQAGRMEQAGFDAVEAAKQDGRWEAAYDSQANAAPPEDFLRELAKDEKARAFFESLNRANVYSIVYRLQTAKTAAVREKRLVAILQMMNRGEKFHP